MAKKEFILQGFTERTHAGALNELFEVDEIERVLMSVAFVSESGVGLILDSLKKTAKVTTTFAGIRNDITSLQGMTALLGLGGQLYAVDTGARTITFHPKFFLVRGSKVARMVMGSANLTLGGLNNNVEAGMGFVFDLGDKADKAVVDDIETKMDSLPGEFDDNIIKVTKTAQLKQWLEDGRLVDEMAQPPPRPAKTAKAKAAGTDTVPRIKLKVEPLKNKVKKAPKSTKPAAPGGAAPKVAAPASGVELELVWESKPLTRRDLNIPDGANTNKTGSINLDKGLLEEDVDHRHYFREDVFSALTWTKRSATVDEAYARFQLVLKGASYGDFDLAVRHTTSTDTESYKQKNAMTRLSWGPTSEYVGREDLIDRTLSLYRDKADATLFVMEID